MAGFQFSLQTVLDYRSREVDLAQQAMGAEAQKLREIQQAMDDLNQMIAQTLQDYETHRLSNGQVQLATTRQFSAYLGQLRTQYQQLGTHLEAQKKRLQVAQEMLRQKRLKEKALELLKEKQQRQFQARRIKAEALELEDLVSTRRHLKLMP